MTNVQTAMISLSALAIPCISLAWNIFKEFRKPRVRVDAKPLLEVLIDAQGVIKEKPLHVLGISAANYGPGEVICQTAVFKHGLLRHRLFRRDRPVVLPLPTSPKLTLGEVAQYRLTWEQASFLALPNVRIGIRDSFGRIHWAAARQMRRTTAAYRELINSPAV